MATEGSDGSGLPGALQLFLTAPEKDTFAEWSAPADRSSASAPAPIVDWLVAQVPETLAPSLLSLAGTLAVVQAWHFAESHAAGAPALAACVITASLVAFSVLREVGRLHGQRLMLDSPVTELFDQVCRHVTATFLAASLCVVLGRVRVEAQWCVAQAVQLGLVWSQYGALLRCEWHGGFLGGLVLGLVGAILLPGMCGWHPLRREAEFLEQRRFTLLLTFYCIVSLHALWAPNEKHPRTRNVLLATLALRGLGGLLRAGLPEVADGDSKLEVVCDGLFATVISSDLVLAKMAGRELHPAVAVASALVLLPHLPLLTLAVAAFYYVAVFADLSSYLKLPLFGVCRNVYCDGIYDLCHIGHKNLFCRASKLGGRLFVGVVGDEDANAYKRPPVMTAAEREAEVAGCKGVTKVIPNAPCFGLTEDFLRKHRIHVVAYGQEYKDRFPNPDDDPYYRVPRKLGIARPMPRTECFSTSELLQRIQTIEAADLKKKSPT